MSFAIDPDAQNLLGMLGHTLGWSLHALIGLSSYGLVFYIGWIGWRMLFCKPIHHLWLKHLYTAAALLSLCMLLSLIESDLPSFADGIGKFFYPGLWAHKMRYHLGGAPLFYLYRDLPSLNLHHILNTVGAALIFSSTLIASLLFLFKISLVSQLQKITASIKKGMEEKEAQPVPADQKNSKEKGKEAEKKEAAEAPLSLKATFYASSNSASLRC